MVVSQSGPRLSVRRAHAGLTSIFTVFLLTVFMWGGELSPRVDGKLGHKEVFNSLRGNYDSTASLALVKLLTAKPLGDPSPVGIWRATLMLGELWKPWQRCVAPNKHETRLSHCRAWHRGHLRLLVPGTYTLLAALFCTNVSCVELLLVRVKDSYGLSVSGLSVAWCVPVDLILVVGRHHLSRIDLSCQGRLRQQKKKSRAFYVWH